MLREAWEIFDDEDETGEPFGFSQYQSTEATIVKLKPGSQQSVRGQTGSGWDKAIVSQTGEFTEGNLYTTIESGAVDYVWEGSIDRNFPGNDYASIYGNKAQYFWTLRDEKNLLYVIQLDTSSDFTDVSEYAYYTYPMIWAISRGITNGTTATTFSPNDPCTRAQILTFIWRYSGKPEPTVSNPFRDVSPDNYYYKAALWAYEKGMVSGTAFNGDTPCDRAAAVTYLWILAGRPDTPIAGDTMFADIGSMEHPEAVAYATRTGITKGTTETTFSPDRVCTRAHIVTFLNRYERQFQGA